MEMAASKNRGESACVSGLLRVGKELFNMSVKSIFCRFGTRRAGAIKYFSGRQSYWYLVFAVVFQILPCSAEAAAPDPRYRVFEFRNRAANLIADGRKLGSNVGAPMLVRCGDGSYGGLNLGAESLTRGCTAVDTVVSLPKIVAQKSNGERAEDNPLIIEDSVKKIIKDVIHGALFALPIRFARVLDNGPERSLGRTAQVLTRDSRTYKSDATDNKRHADERVSENQKSSRGGRRFLPGYIRRVK